MSVAIDMTQLSSIRPPGSVQYIPTPPKTRDSSPNARPPGEERYFQTVGYDGFSKWLGASQDAVVLRRFNQLNARVIMFMQYEIRCKEQELQKLDDDARNLPGRRHNGSFGNDEFHRRNEILKELKKDLKEYNDFIISHRSLRSNPQASDRDVKNIESWFWNYGQRATGNAGAIHKNESEFIKMDGDLVSLVPKVKTPLRKFLEKFDAFLLFRPFQIKKEKADYFWNFRPSRKTTHYHDDDRINATITAIITTLGLAMMIGPIWLLERVPNSDHRLIVISVFLVFFTILLSIVTVAKPFETLAASAAYGAVLMVFMQLNPGPSSGGGT